MREIDQEAEIDTIFAETVVNRAGVDSEGAIKGVAKIFQLARLGHICCELAEPLRQALASPIVQQFDSQEEAATHPICAYKGKYYLARNWNFESRVVKGLLRLLQFSCEPIVLTHSLSGLTEEQKKAVETVLENSITVVSGGPGRGKSYTATQLLHTLPDTMRIVITAPTGKAASHLYQNIQSSLTHLDITYKTLHALCDIQKREKKLSFIEADLVIVDECSMIDAYVFARLFELIHPKTRILLMGDEDQLPPVETGNVFAEICRFAKTNSSIPYVFLQKCLRTDRQEMIALADAVNSGDQEVFNHVLRQETSSIQFSAIEQFDSEFLKQRLKLHFSNFPKEIPKAFEMLQTFKILNALKVGAMGTDQLNLTIASFWEEISNSTIYPIIITQSDYALELFNGEMGCLSGEEAYFFSKDGAMRTFPKALLPKYELSFAISVHKSQGSEYNHVLLLLPDGAQNFGKELLYTGITRAKYSIEILADETIVHDCMNKDTLRKSAICERLLEFV